MAYFRRRGDKWSFTLDVGRDQNTGKRKQKTVSGFSSEKEARKACSKMERDLEAGKRTDSMKFDDFIKLFFETIVINKVEQGTYNSQWIIVQKYIIPKLGHKKIDKITAVDLDIFYSDLLKDGVSRGYIKNIAQVISKTFKQASIWNYIIKNVAKESSSPSYKPKEMSIWTEEQLTHFLQESREFERHALYVLAGTSGMRIGEILALDWDDIDFKKSTVSITKSLKHTKQKGLHVKRPKTENSKRVIHIPHSTLQVLIEHKNKQLPGVSIVFDNKGSYFYTNNVWRYFISDSAKVGMPRIRLHDLRHTHASILLSWGYNAKVVAERLGDTVETVMNTYAHVLPNMQEEVAIKLNQLYAH
ncbi:tyrosine-type recombinase/integrase [Paenibacillus chitinolyticus]|nr:tyrosine-type recombinase/integrase [Paenibacillus chitinolyticus]MCY9593761.1 tyrosine-type recombinase/integrase [Paenibacillus chitinolyticus]MCY9599674.1 tyrosine-type recombinase/integrase [Paenibacillus chitinolyticus]